jgi:hypothetical protein
MDTGVKWAGSTDQKEISAGWTGCGFAWKNRIKKDAGFQRKRAKDPQKPEQSPALQERKRIQDPKEEGWREPRARTHRAMHGCHRAAHTCHLKGGATKTKQEYGG